MNENNKPCPQFPFFGASYPDACCINGKLYDMDKCDENSNLYEKDYETVFNYALLKCADIYAKANNIEINLFSNNENKS